MSFKITATAFLAFVSAVAAQTSGFDAVTTPAKDEVVPACSNYVIKWDYTSTYDKTVTLQLLQGATSTTLQLGAVIASGVQNSLSQYTWAVDSSLGADATYGIKITYDGDSSGNTFQYSNPFSIKSCSSGSSTTSSAAVAATPAQNDAGAPASESTVFSTEMVTITSCAATVTDCPARSTVVSSSVYSSVVPTAPASAAAAAPPAVNAGGVSPASSSAAAAATTARPSYPAGNGTSPYTGMGTVTVAKSSATGSGSAPTTSSVVTGGAGRAAAGSLVAFVGLAAAAFAL